MKWNKFFENLKELFPKCLLGGMWLYALITGLLFLVSYFHKECPSQLLKGMVFALPLFAVLLERFSSLKKRFLCFVSVVLLRDVLYWLGIAIWQHGFAQDSLTMITTFAVGMFTILVLETFFLFFYHLEKTSHWVLVFTLPFILSIVIGLIHMWGCIVF